MRDDLRAARDMLARATYEPNPWGALAAEALNSAEETGRDKERRRWLDWLAKIGYGQDFVSDDEPPCSPRDLAEVLNESEPLDFEAEDGETGVDVWVWVLAENTGWESKP